MSNKIQRTIATNSIIGPMRPDGIFLSVDENGVIDITNKVAKTDLSNITLGYGLSKTSDGVLSSNLHVSDSITSESTDVSASSKAVKLAYDKSYEDNNNLKTQIDSNINGVKTELETKISDLAGRISDETKLQPGTIVTSLASSYPGALFCDGSAVSKKTYAKLFAVIGNAFGAGDTSDKFRIPDIKGKVLQGAGGNNIILNKSYAPGVQNIIGNIYKNSNTKYAIFGSPANGITQNGALYVNTSHNGYVDADTSADSYYCGFLGFDASKTTGNAVYGKASGVQPPAIGVNFFIVY